MECTIPVTDSDIFVNPQTVQFLVGMERIPRYPPPGVGIELPGKEVDEGIDIRGEVISRYPDIFGCIDNDGNGMVGNMLPCPPDQFRGSCPSGEKCDHHSIVLSARSQDCLGAR